MWSPFFYAWGHQVQVRESACRVCGAPVFSPVRPGPPASLCEGACTREWNRRKSAAWRASNPERNRENSRRQMQEWRAKNPGRWRELHYRSELKRVYSLSPERYEAILASQGFGCAVCGAEHSEAGRRLHVDHDHRCCPGKKSCGECIRGLLCGGCNSAAGYVADNPARLRRLAAYLEASRSPQLRLVS